MSRLEKYINYYLNKYKRIEFSHIDNINLLKQYDYNIDVFINYNFVDYLYILYAGNSTNNYELFYSLIKKYHDYFEKIIDEDYAAMLVFYKRIEKIKEEDFYKNFMLIGKDYSDKLEEFSKLDYPEIVKEFLSKLFTKEDGNIDFDAYNSFIEHFLNKDSLILFRTITEIYKLKKVIKETNAIEGKRQKTKNKVIDDYSFMTKRIISVITGTKYRLEKEYRELEKEKNKNISLLESLQKDINSGGLINLEKYKRLDEEKIINEIVIYNSKLLDEKYKNVKIDNKELINNEVEKFEEELLTNNICIDFNKIEISLEEARNKIEIIKKYPNIIKYNNIVLYLINSISLNNLDRLFNLIDNKIIDELFILNNILRLKEENVITNFLDNIKLFNINNININNVIKYNYEILFFNNKYLIDILSKYMKYGIDISLECYNYEWLEKDMCYIIDGFIEIGQYSLIRNNLSLLNSNSLMIIKRCMLYSCLNNSVVNEQGKLRGSLRKEENFIMNDKELNETILTNYDLFIPADIIECFSIENVVYSEFNLSCIEEYLIDEYTYKFKNILISKNKVIRNLSVLFSNNLDNMYSMNDLLLYSIIYNYPNIISKSDFEYLKEILDNKKKLTLN